jgi:hypothetical protein
MVFCHYNSDDSHSISSSNLEVISEENYERVPITRFGFKLWQMYESGVEGASKMSSPVIFVAEDIEDCYLWLEALSSYVI